MLKTLLPYLLAFVIFLVALLVHQTDAATKEHQKETIWSLEQANTSLAKGIKDLQAKLATVQSIDTSRVQSADSIRSTTKVILREVPRLLPATLGPVEFLPPGWGLLHDAAASGAATALDPASTGRPDDSTITPQAAAETIIENYGICRDTADRLTHLQDYVTQVVQPGGGQ